MVERKDVKKILSFTLFNILLVLYYFLYGESAINKYIEKRTTIVQSRENKSNRESPVFIICVDPPLKASYLKEQIQNLNNFGYLEKFFWTMPNTTDLIKNGTSEVIDIYMNMSHILGLDLQIFVYQFHLK